MFSIPVAAWNKLYLKSFLDENDIRFPNENLIHEDNPFYCKMITSAERISILNRYFHNRRRRDGSIMTWNNERLFDNFEIIYRVLNIFLEDPKLYEYYKKEVLFYMDYIQHPQQLLKKKTLLNQLDCYQYLDTFQLE